MTFRAMRHCLGQVLSPVSGLTTIRIGSERSTIEVQEFPEADEPPDLEWKCEIMGWGLAGNRRQRSQVRHEVADVARIHLGETRIGKYRVVMRTGWRHAAQKRIGKINGPP